MQTLRKGSTDHDAVAYLQTLLNSPKLSYVIAVDGIFGPETEKTVMDFQRFHNLVVDGIVGQKTWRTLFAATGDKYNRKFLSERDLKNAAIELGVDIAVIKAVNEVEAQGVGFIGDRPKILFEGHVFWRRLKKHGVDPNKWAPGNSDILYRRWTRQYYLGGLREYERLNKAKDIHEAAAFESASWGMFQIMGFHWESLGYSSVQDFVDRMHENEGEHLKSFVKYIQVNNLTQHLQKLDWASFAEGYNGPAYIENLYDVKMKSAYRRYAAA